MYYNLLVLNNTGCIRAADKGLSDIEWSVGVRIRSQCNNRYTLTRIMEIELKSMDEEEFGLMITELKDSDGEPGVKKISRPMNPEVYDSGPYSKYTRGR
mgnify:CR=1 FL=1